ncbi:MAG: hypothetical protein O3A14_16855 [Cyanobacteria bacterium]|nr:hypothetical protein [Cyanobacteriota bacterium]
MTLTPIDYRYRPRNQQFRKYQWVEVDLMPRGAGNDRRKESRQPNLDSLRVLGQPLSTENGWRARREIIDQMPVYTIKQLRELHNSERMSLGIVRPNRVLDLKIEAVEPEWKSEWQLLFDQLSLFGPVQKPLRKIPYKFSYVFECEDSHRTHNAMIEDWELGVLWLNEVVRLGNEKQAALSVKRKFFDELCSDKKDTLFFMGTVFPYNTWVVLGIFWPPKLNQMTGIQGTLF